MMNSYILKLFLLICFTNLLVKAEDEEEKPAWQLGNVQPAAPNLGYETPRLRQHDPSDPLPFNRNNVNSHQYLHQQVGIQPQYSPQPLNMQSEGIININNLYPMMPNNIRPGGAFANSFNPIQSNLQSGGGTKGNNFNPMLNSFGQYPQVQPVFAYGQHAAFNMGQTQQPGNQAYLRTQADPKFLSNSLSDLPGSAASNNVGLVTATYSSGAGQPPLLIQPEGPISANSDRMQNSFRSGGPSGTQTLYDTGRANMNSPTNLKSSPSAPLTTSRVVPGSILPPSLTGKFICSVPIYICLVDRLNSSLTVFILRT